MRPADRDMNRTERLFALMDALRRHRRPVTAASLAGELEHVPFRWTQFGVIAGHSPRRRA
jgi:hypothetical protein